MCVCVSVPLNCMLCWCVFVELIRPFIYFATRWQQTIFCDDTDIIKAAFILNKTQAVAPVLSQVWMEALGFVLMFFGQASEGYFSQSQEEDFAQSDECSAKVNPTPVFYNKPPGKTHWNLYDKTQLWSSSIGKCSETLLLLFLQKLTSHAGTLTLWWMKMIKSGKKEHPTTLRGRKKNTFTKVITSLASENLYVVLGIYKQS